MSVHSVAQGQLELLLPLQHSGWWLAQLGPPATEQDLLLFLLLC